MVGKTSVSSQEPIKDKKLVSVELPEEVWKIVSKSLNSEVKFIKKVNVEHPALWKIQDDIADALKQAIDTINKAVSEKRT